MTLLALCRFAHFMAAMLVFGSSAFLALYAPQDLRRALSPGLRRLALAASLVALITALFWLALEAASMADDWGAATPKQLRLRDNVRVAAAGWSSSKRSKARALRARHRRPASGSTPHDRDRRPPCLAAPLSFTSGRASEQTSVVLTASEDLLQPPRACVTGYAPQERLGRGLGIVEIHRK